VTEQAGGGRSARRTGRLVVAVAALLAMLIPVGVVFTAQWNATRDNASFVADERAGVAYVQPLSTLLVALVDARAAVAYGRSPDAAGVRAAVAAVTAADERLGSHLGVRQRWSPLPGQIDGALRQKTSTGYDTTIGLTRALLATIGDQARVVRDPTVDAFHLADAALLRVPDAVVAAGDLAGLARSVRRAPADPGNTDAVAGDDASGDDASGDGASGVDQAPAVTGLDDRYPVAVDRLTVAGAAIRDGLRSGTDAHTGDALNLDVLKPLDAFVAAVDALSHAATAHAASGTGAAAVDNAARAVTRTAATLQAAVLAALDAMVADRAADLNRQTQITIGAAVLAILALAGVLAVVWLGSRRPAPRPAPPPPTAGPPPPMPPPLRGGEPVGAGIGQPFLLAERGDPLPRRSGAI
jgi:hypothetical protein